MIKISITDENYDLMFKGYTKEGIEREINQYWIPSVMVSVRDNHNRGHKFMHLSLSELDKHSVLSMLDDMEELI